MLEGLWKKLFIGVTVLLVISLIFLGNLWYQLNTAVKPTIDSFVAEREQMLNSYVDLRNEINRRTDVKEGARFFITPDDPEISAKVQEIAGGYSTEELWNGYIKLFRWVMRNIEYSLDSPAPLLPESLDGTLEWRRDFWRTPVETIEDGRGDCEDVSLLLTSMFLNYNQRKFPVWIIGVRNYGSNPKAHVAVAIPVTDNQLTILDIASHYYTHFTDLGGYGTQALPLALNHWLAHLDKEISGVQVYVAFSEDFYREFSGNEEFVDWMTRLY